MIARIPVDAARASRQALVALRDAAARGLPPLDCPAFATTRLPGAHATSIRSLGRGLSYAESRPYQRGDDVRSIDWRVTARHGRPFTKVFERERERPLWILVDLAPSMFFGSRQMFKAELVARAAAWLAWSALAGGDRIGGAVCTGAESTFLLPQRGDGGVFRLIDSLAEALACGPSGKGSAFEMARAGSFAQMLERLQTRVLAGDGLCVISDFYETDEPGRASAAFGALESLAARAGIMLFHVFDPLEVSPPPVGTYPIASHGDVGWLDLADPALREAWPNAHRARALRLAETSRRNGWPLASLGTDGDLLASLSSLFARRAPR